VGILLVIYIHFLMYLAFTHRRHAGGDRGMTKKYRNHEAPRSTRNFLVATQRETEEKQMPRQRTSN